MNPEKTVAYKEMLLSPEELGNMFVHRWFSPEILTEETLRMEFLSHVGERLKYRGSRFPKSDPDWDIPRWQDRLSVLNLYDLDRIDQFNHSDRKKTFRILWQEIYGTLDLLKLYLDIGDTVEIRDSDFLVTTPIAKAREHVKEAQSVINRFNKYGHIDYYYRDCWPFPKNLKIGSKFFYVDNRAIRGFAIVTNIDIKRLRVQMNVDTWRWISPIPCDYGKVKPPQKYASAKKHQYFEQTHRVPIVGSWLDPMPHTIQNSGVIYSDS